MKRLELALERLNPAILLGIALIQVALGSGVQHFAGPSFAAGFLLLLPIGLITWRLGQRAGILFSAIGTVGWVAGFVSAGGESRPVLLVWNGGARLITFLVIVVLIHHLRRTLEEARAAAEQDFLTGIPNVRAFDRAAQAELTRAQQTGLPFTLAYLDLDNFKRINDRQGHRQGDRVLIEVAQALRSSLRNVDTVARIGGDEFVLLLVETDAAGARVAVRRVQHALGELPDKVTCSLGAVTFNLPPSSLDEMIRVADETMYTVKHGGKDSCLYRLFDRERVTPRVVRRRSARPHPSRPRVSA